MENMNLWCVKACWGNYTFDYAHSDSVVENQKIDAEIDTVLLLNTTINMKNGSSQFIQHLAKIQANGYGSKAEGIMVDGKWQDNPKIVKSEFLLHFRKRFERPSDNRIFLDMNFPKTISLDQQTELESAVSKEEVKKAVDFEKAYDSVRWDFLDDVLKKFGFGNKWCDWIQKCLRSSRGSILINGSPTEEFSFFKGLKQGDPLSPFLFILIMESLHLSFQSVVDVDLFKGINLSPLVNLSHMFYADDAVFVGQWCDDNINTLVHVLECFFRASGLRINMCKSKIMGVNVGDDKIKAATLKLGCRILNTPFTYLGTKVGGNMSRVQAWTEIVDKSDTVRCGGSILLPLNPIYQVLVQKACRGECESGLLNGMDQGVGYDVDIVLIQNLDSVKNWNDRFFWVDEFVVPANARFNWFSGSNVSKDRAPVASEYNVEHASILITHASPFLSMRAETMEIDLNAFIRTADPRKVRIVERARADNEEPIVIVAKHRTVTLLPTLVVRPSRELSASIERKFVGDAGGSGGGDQEIAFVGGHGNVEPIVPTTDNVVAEIEAPGPRRSKKKRVTRGSEGIPAASHPPKRLRADYGTTGGSAVRGKSPSVLNRLLQDSLLTVEHGVPALPTLHFITSFVTASPFEEGGDHTDSVNGPSLRTVGPSTRFVVLSDSSHHSGAKSADPEVDSFVRSVTPVMTTATTVTAFVFSVAATATTSVDVGKDKDVSALSIFSCSSSSDKTDRTLSLFTGKSGSEFVAGSIRAGGDADVDLQEIYIPEWSMTKGFELNDGRSCVNMIDHFTPPAFFKTVRGMEHEQLFDEFNVSAARNLSLSSEVRMRAEYNILEKKKWKSLAGEKDNLLQVKDKEIEELRS
ncbi:RNA-directed DNA polymerase, eukaryota [Tanacetum coccineum]